MKEYLFKSETGITDEHTLYASDIMLNQKSNDFYPFAHLGEALAIAYQAKETLHAFAYHLCKVFQDGADMQYQPTMRTKIKGKELFISGNATCIRLSLVRNFVNEETPTNEAAYNYPFADVLEWLRIVLHNNEEIRFVLADGFSDYMPDFNYSEVQRELNTIAQDTNTFILWGFRLQDTEMLNDRNVCYLLNDVYKDTPFFWFVYGYPDAKRMVYSTNEDGNVIIPTIDEGCSSTASLKKMVIMEHLCKLFASKMISRNNLSKLMEGAFGGNYAPKTINTFISLAVEHGILQPSGEMLIYAESNSNRKSYKNNIAIVAPSYSKPCKCENAKQNSFIRFGETKLIFGKIADKFIRVIIKAIISGKELDFKLKTKHKNILVALIADDEQVQAYKEMVTAYAESKNFAANIDVVGIAKGITKAQFLIEFKDLYGRYKPDFYFVQNLQNVSLDKQFEDPLPYVKELAQYAKSKCFVLIAHANNDWGDLENKDKWDCPELLEDKTLCFIDTILSDLYDFTTKCGSRYIFTRYKIADNGKLIKPSSTTEREAYLDGAFAESCAPDGCTREELHDSYGLPINDTQLKKAIGLKIAYQKDGRIYYCQEDRR